MRTIFPQIISKISVLILPHHPVEEGDDGVGAGAREEACVLPSEGDGVGDAALLVKGQRLCYAIVPERRYIVGLLTPLSSCMT